MGGATAVVPREPKLRVSPAPLLREAIPVAVPQVVVAVNGSHVSTEVMNPEYPGSVGPSEVGLLEVMIAKANTTPLGLRLVLTAHSSNCTVMPFDIELCNPVSARMSWVGVPVPS